MSSNSKGQIVGYARVSASDQNLERQLSVLGHADRIFTEKASGKSQRERPQLRQMIDFVREGDLVVVKSPDRLARSTMDLLSIVSGLREKGVGVQFVDTPTLNTDTPQGEFILTILGAAAQLERATLLERQAEGIALARARGVYDRGPKLSSEQVSEARARVSAGVPKAKVARDLGVARSTLYEALNGTGRYADGAEGSK